MNLSYVYRYVIKRDMRRCDHTTWLADYTFWSMDYIPWHAEYNKAGGKLIVIVAVKTCQQEAQTVSTKYGMVDCKLWYVSKKMMPTFRTFFRNAFAPQIKRLLLQIERLLPRIGRFLLKKWKDYSDENWVCAHISFQNTVHTVMYGKLYVISATMRPSNIH